jgi:hypothetical protein
LRPFVIRHERAVQPNPGYSLRPKPIDHECHPLEKLAPPISAGTEMRFDLMERGRVVSWRKLSVFIELRYRHEPTQPVGCAQGRSYQPKVEAIALKFVELIGIGRQNPPF